MYLQGDIVAILDSAGSVVVQYKYDVWGKPISKTGSMASTLGTVQPFRYRGYVYDEETGLYYLRSRFFSCRWNRFVNEDSCGGRIGVPLSHNAYGYCFNSPVFCIDKCGCECEKCAEGNGNIAYSFSITCNDFGTFALLVQNEYPREQMLSLIESMSVELLGVAWSEGNNAAGNAIVGTVVKRFNQSSLIYSLYDSTVNVARDFHIVAGSAFADDMHLLSSCLLHAGANGYVTFTMYSTIDTNILVVSAHNMDGSPIDINVGGVTYPHTYRYEDSHMWDAMPTRTFGAIATILETCFDAMSNHFHPVWRSTYEDYFGD